MPPCVSSLPILLLLGPWSTSESIVTTQESKYNPSLPPFKVNKQAHCSQFWPLGGFRFTAAFQIIQVQLSPTYGGNQSVYRP